MLNKLFKNFNASLNKSADRAIRIVNSSTKFFVETQKHFNNQFGGLRAYWQTGNYR